MTSVAPASICRSTVTRPSSNEKPTAFVVTGMSISAASLNIVCIPSLSMDALPVNMMSALPSSSMAVFRAEVGKGDPQASDEGALQFITMDELEYFPLVEDIPILLPKVMKMNRGMEALHAHYHYLDGELNIEFK